MSLGSRIKEVRGRVSQADFAEMLGVSARSLGYYEANKRAPDAHFIANLCRHSGRSADYLLFGQDSRSPYADDLQEEIDELRARISELLAERLKLLDDAKACKTHAGGDSIVEVINLADSGINGWQVLSGGKMWIEAPTEITKDSGFAVIAVGDSMRPEGIYEGCICFCTTKFKPKKGDVVFVERSDGLASIKIYGGETEHSDKHYIVARGWQPADKDSFGEAPRPLTWDILQPSIKCLAVVLYVKRPV